jgi:hypothetical protein
VPEHKSKKESKPVDRWLGVAGMALGLLLFLLPKTQPIIIGCLLLIWLLLLHPTINFWWVENRPWRQCLAFVALTVSLVWLGLYIKPEAAVQPQPQQQETKRETVPTTPAPVVDESSRSRPTSAIERPLLRLMFKDSPLFTTERRDRITKDVSGFAAYLEGLGIPVPKDIPPIGVDTKDPKASAWSFNDQSSTKYYYNKFMLGPSTLDDRQKITEAFGTFVIGRFLYKPPPAVPIEENQTPQQFYDALHTPEQMDYAYRWMASVAMTQYLNHSYWNRPFDKNQQPVCPDQGDGMAYYFWKARLSLGKQFTDKLAAFTLRAVIDKPYTDSSQHYRQYFYERLTMADSVIDNESAKMPSFDAILKDCGWLTK